MMRAIASRLCSPLFPRMRLHTHANTRLGRTAGARLLSPMTKVMPTTAQPLSQRLGVFAKRMCSSAAGLEEQYTKSMQWMHWVYAAGMLTVVGTVKASQYTTSATSLGTKGQTKGKLMLIHKSTAVLLTALLVPRVLIRAMSKIPAHLPGNFFEKMGANLSHAAMYFFMIAMPTTGIAMGYYGGKGVPFYGIYTFPGKADKTKEDGQFAGKMFKWHKQTGVFLEYLIPLHVGAVGFHLLKGQPILTRINPFAAVPK